MTAHYLNTLRRFSRDVRLFLFTWAVFGFSFFGIYVILLNLYLLRLGYGPEFIGLVNAAAPLALAVASLPAGALGARWGIRRAMTLGVSLIALGLALLPLGEWIARSWQASWIVGAYAMVWIGGAQYLVSGGPFMIGATSPAERPHLFSVQTALPPLFAFGGSLVGGLLPGVFARALGLSLDHPAPFRYTLLIGAALLVPAVLAMLAMRDSGSKGVDDPPATVAQTGPAPLGLIGLIALITLLRFAGEGAGRTFLNVYLEVGLHLPTAQIGALLAVSQLLSVPAALAAPLLMARWGKGRTFVWGSVGMALCLVPMALIPHWIAAGLGFVGLLGMASATGAALGIFSQEAVAPGWRTAMSGAFTMALGLSFSGTALGGGYVITVLGYSSLFLMGAVLSTAGALLFWLFFEARGRAATEESTTLRPVSNHEAEVTKAEETSW